MAEGLIEPLAKEDVAVIGHDRRASFALPGLLLATGALVCAIISLLILLRLTPIRPESNVIIGSATINALFVIGLLFLIGREILRLLKARSRGRAAARLHVRIVALFSIVAITPAILVAIFASITLDVGLDRWFFAAHPVDRPLFARCGAGLYDGKRQLSAGTDRLHGQRPGAQSSALQSRPDRFHRTDDTAGPRTPACSALSLCVAMVRRSFRPIFRPSGRCRPFRRMR